MAMHIHACFSEGIGSMAAQLAQAVANGVEVLWWTEHDWRMAGYGYRRVVHFDALTEQEDGLPWTWVPTTTGSLSAAAGDIVRDPASPLDPSGSGSLRVTAVGVGARFAYHRYRADASGSRQNSRGSLAGQTLMVEVFPQETGADAMLEIRIVTSWRPATGSRSAGQYVLSYRIGGPDRPGTRRGRGRIAVVTVPATPGEWNSLELDPAADLSAIWPDVDGRDASLYDLFLGAGSRRQRRARGCFDYLRFSRATTGDVPLKLQAELMAAATADFPSVVQRAGLELSLHRQHVNWYGGTVTLPAYGSLPIVPVPEDAAATRALVDDIHRTGGVASCNHLFHPKTGLTRGLTAPPERLLRTVAMRLLDERAFGADVLEVGYRQRGATLADHVAAWDLCSRNGLFLTGNGASDDHHGTDWRSSRNNFLTWAWAPGPAEADLLAALRAGRVFFGDMARFSGTLDITVDGACPMGSASVSREAARAVTIAATGIPAGGTVWLVQVPVDYAGAAVPKQHMRISTFPDSAFKTGAATVTCDTTRSSFVRAEIVDGTGTQIAFSNPVWLLREAPPQPIPTARVA